MLLPDFQIYGFMIILIGLINESVFTIEKSMMTATDVLDLYNKLDRLGITIWLNGGWGVDANLGKQTRPHGDLDIFIQRNDVAELREFLTERGYKEIKLEIARPHNFVLGDADGREVDVHVIVFIGGNAVYGPPGSAEVFADSVFSSVGNIAGQKVRCITPECQVKWHTGYKPRETDLKDVTALCKKFGIEYPAGYEYLEEL
jgi:lincosamide nucleotidyltransferase A/C/D/E